VKRRDLIKKIEEEGGVLIRHGGKPRLVPESSDKSLPAGTAAQ